MGVSSIIINLIFKKLLLIGLNHLHHTVLTVKNQRKKVMVIFEKKSSGWFGALLAWA